LLGYYSIDKLALKYNLEHSKNLIKTSWVKTSLMNTL